MYQISSNTQMVISHTKKKLWMRISWASQASFGSMWGCDDFVKFSYMKTLMCTPMSMKMGLG